MIRRRGGRREGAAPPVVEEPVGDELNRRLGVLPKVLADGARHVQRRALVRRADIVHLRQSGGERAAASASREEEVEESGGLSTQ